MSGQPNRSIPGVILRAIICINGPNDTIGRTVINKNRLLVCFGEKEIRVSHFKQIPVVYGLRSDPKTLKPKGSKKFSTRFLI